MKKPEVIEYLKNDAFFVNCTQTPFSRVAVDMTFKRTINAEAKNRLKGIMAFARINSAVNRWQVTSNMKTQIIKSLFEITEIKNYNAETKSLNHPRTERDHQDLQALTAIINSKFKPFLPTVNQISLFNLKTGKQGSKPTEAYLLTVLEEGNSNRHTYVEQCQKRGDRFEEPIKKSKISNFATENFSKKNKSTQASKFHQAKGTLDIFYRLLFFPFTKQIDVKRIFAYPLVPEPPCFCHPDGSLCDSPKPNVFHYWKGLVQSDSPPNVETVIADGMPLIRSILHCRILQIICANSFEDCLKTNSSSRRYLFRCLRIDIT